MTRWRVLGWACLLAALGAYAASFFGSASVAATRRATVRPSHRKTQWIAVRPLAHGSLPDRQTFTIKGERYRFQGRVYFTLAISIDRPGEPPGGGGGASFNPSQVPGTLAYSALVACHPHPYAVVFGLLRAPSDVVLVRRGDKKVVLVHVPIPGVLRAHGVLAYKAIAGPPREVILQRPDGKRLRDDKLPWGGCSPGAVIVF